MTQSEFLEKLEEIMDLEEGLNMDSLLDDFDEWDSLSALGLTLFAKNELGKVLTTAQLVEFKTPADVYAFCYGA